MSWIRTSTSSRTASPTAGRPPLTVGTSNEFLKLRNAFLQASTGVWAFDSLDDFEAGIAERVPAPLRRQRSRRSPARPPSTCSSWASTLQDNWSPLKGLTRHARHPHRRAVPVLGQRQRRLSANEAFPIDTSEVPSGNILWSPRLGLRTGTWRAGNTIVRGGVGIFAGRPPYVWVANAYSINGLSQVELTCNRTSGSRQVPTFTARPQRPAVRLCRRHRRADGARQPGRDRLLRSETRSIRRTSAWRSARTAACRMASSPPPTCSTRGTSTAGTRPTRTWSARARTARAARPTASSTARSRRRGFRANARARRRRQPRPGREGVQQERRAHLQRQLQLQKEISTRSWMPPWPTRYTNAVDRISLTSSQALSNFQFAPLDGSIQDRYLRPSAFDRTHRVTLTAHRRACPAASTPASSTWASRACPTPGRQRRRQRGRRQRQRPGVRPGRAQTRSRCRIPRSTTALSKFIDSQSCLREAKGRFVQRGACRNPWQNFVNLRVGWNVPGVRQGPAPRAAAGHLQRPEPASTTTGACSIRTRPSRTTRRSSCARWATTPRTTGRSTASPSPPR